MLKGKINDVKNEGRKPKNILFGKKKREFFFMLVDHNGMYVILAAPNR